MSSDPIHLHRPSSLAIATAMTALAAAVGFHFLLYGRLYGFGFAFFMILLFTGVNVLVLLTGKRGNVWAYLFAIPFVLSLAAEILYASDVVRGVGFLVAVASLAFFSYWFASPPVRFWDVRTLWPPSLAIETLLPFGTLGTLFGELMRERRHASRIVMGIVLAAPLMLIIGALFVSSDALVQKTLNAAFGAERLGPFVARAIWDGFALVFFAAVGWSIVTRIVESRRAVQRERSFSMDHVSVGTALVLLNLLFAAFLGFQAVYFFGGDVFVQAQGIAYAEYAREGFFQLLWVAILVAAALVFVYRATHMRHAFVRAASVFLAAQTGAVIASAIRRMTLYIDAYGLSVQRFWALEIIFVIAALLLLAVVAIIGRLEFDRLVKIVVVSLFVLAGASLLVNADRIVAEYNVGEFLAGRTDQMDTLYLTHLSSDAVPALVRLAEARPDLAMIDKRMRPIRAVLRDRDAYLRALGREDWRNLVFSDYVAIAALGALK